MSVREMMFGLGDEFIYLTCDKCGCLQISEIPENIGWHYKPDYYSFSEDRRKLNAPVLFKNKRRYHTRFFLRNFVRFLPLPKTIYHILGGFGIALDDKVLDVGAGAGALVAELSDFGFREILGIDPFINKEIKRWRSRIIVRRTDIYNIELPWKLIMFNHSLEHMDEHERILGRCCDLLEPKGLVLIRIPTVSSFAFRKYKENWVQLDAPRHFYLHSRKSILLLSEKSGFNVVRIWDDSAQFQFVGSEQYMQGIPLMSEHSHIINPHVSIFTKKQINRYKKTAKILNKAGDGDQICVLLARK